LRSTEVDSDFLKDFAGVLEHRPKPSKVNVDPEKVEQGLVKLVLGLVELLRQLMEKQAIRRIEGGSLTDEEIDRLGVTLMKLEQRIRELQEYFEIDDLNINLGPLGNLID
jgi:hypothetical protein